jgi:hypothetical protein
MTEPIKLPPLGRAVGIWAPAYGENEVRDYACRAVESYKATTELPPIDLFNLPPDVKKVAQSYARLAVEQATADLREALRVTQVEACKSIERLQAERNEARAELARLTTLRPMDGYFHRAGDRPVLFHYRNREPSTTYCAGAIGWTPLPPVKEADHD